MISMRIKLNKKRIDDEEIFDYDTLVSFLMEKLNERGCETWIDDRNCIHCDMYDILYRDTCEEMNEIYKWLAGIDWFARYCSKWLMLSEYNYFHVKDFDGNVNVENLFLEEWLHNPLFSNVVRFGDYFSSPPKN